MDPDLGHELEVLRDAVLAIAEDLDLDGTLRRIVAAGRAMVGARYGALGVLTPDGAALATFIHDGMDPDLAERIGPLPTGHGVLGEVIRTGAPLLLDRLTSHPSSSPLPPGHPPMTTFLGVPVRIGGEVFGNLYLTDAPSPFTDDDRRRVEALAAIAGAAIRNARAARTSRSLALANERERIARDLHDTVIQRVFGAALRLDGVTRQLDADAPARVTIEGALVELDGAIGDLRAIIAALDEPAPPDLAEQLSGVLEALAPIAPGLQGLRTVGDLGRVPPGIVSEVVPVVREAVTNAARHAQASRIVVTAAASIRTLDVTVDDDGVGPAAPQGARGSTGLGLGNLAERATALGGRSDLSARVGGGSRLRWSVPLPD